MKNLFNFNRFSMSWREEGKSQKAERMQGWNNAEKVMTSEDASIQHPFSIHSASIQHPMGAAGDLHETSTKAARAFLRYAAMLLMLLTLGVGQMWAWWYAPGDFSTWTADNGSKMNGSNTITYYAVPAGTYEFQLVKESTWGHGSLSKSGSAISSVCANCQNGHNKIVTTATADLTFTITDEGSWACTITASEPTYHLKYSWGNSGWSWKTLVANGDGTYSCSGLYRGSNSGDVYNYEKRTSNNDSWSRGTGTASDVTLENSPSSTSHNCIFTYNPSNHKLTIRKCNTVTTTNYIYFYNRHSWSDSYIYFVIGHPEYSATYRVTNIANTKLYYVANSSDNWTDAGYYGMIGAGSTFGSGSWGQSNMTAANHYTAAYTTARNLANGKTILVTPNATNSNGQAMTISSDMSSYTELNYSQTVQKRTCTGANDPSAVANFTQTEVNSGTVTISAYKMTGNGTASNTSNSATLDEASETSASVDAAYSGKVTYTASANTGYTFVGWATTALGSIVSTDATYNRYPTSSGTVYARFKENQYTAYVQTYTHGSSPSPSSATTMGQITGGSISVTPNTGYRFVNWTLNSGSGSFADATSASTTFYPTSNSQLRANIVAKSYTITLNGNGGSDGSITTTYDSSTGSSFSAASYAGHSCDGYFTAKTDGTKVLNSDGTIPSSTVSNYLSSGNWVGDTVTVLWAHWTEDITNYTVTYDVVGHGELSAANSSTSAAITSGGEVANGTGVTFTADPDDYYEIEGWYTDEDCTEGKHDAGETEYSTTISSADLAVYVKFQPITYTISYTLNGGSNNGSNPDSYNYESSITLQDPSRSGYTFGGWYTESTFENRVYSIAAKSNGNKAFWAKWTANPYTITLNNHDATTAGTTSISVTFDATTNLTGTPAITVPQKDGYTFGGYYTGESGSGTQIIAANGNVNASAGGGSTYTSATKQWKYAGDITLHAKWTARPYKIVGILKPTTWTNVYAYAYKDNGGSAATRYNATWPGIRLDNGLAGTGLTPSDEDACNLYYYKFYTDGLAGDAEGNGTQVGGAASAWDKVIFNNGASPGTEGDTKTRSLNINASDNSTRYYRRSDAAGATGATSAFASDWYLRGNFNGSDKWSSDEYPITIDCSTNTGYIVMESLSSSNTQYLRIYQQSTDKWYRITSSSSNAELSIGTDYTLYNQGSGADYFTPVSTTDYRFSLNVATPSAPVLTVVPAADEDYSVTIAVNGHGSISTPGTGSKTIHQYAPTTITAVADPGYRFTGWTVDGAHNSYVSFANASSTTTTVTGVEGAGGATITANFSNEGFVYFDRSAVNGVWSGDKVYMTCLDGTGLWWSDDNGGLVVQNWVHEDVHNKEMHRIPNSNIYYYDCYGHLPSKILFTDKTHPHGGGGNFYNLYDMGAVVEETVNLGQDNMFVVENYNWKDKNKVGYCDGYWMKYNDTYSGLEIRFFDAGGTELNNDYSPKYFTTERAGDREFKATVSLSGGTTYRYKVKGWNGLWYTNEGTMTNNNSSSWPFYYKSERVGSGNCSFNTTGAGQYTFTLSCTNSGVLKVSLEFPLDVDDYRVVYQGKIKEGASASSHPSDFIRHLSAAGNRKDTISFYVREDWSLQLQKCNSFDGSGNPVWGNVGSAISKASLGITENGVYTFIVEQTHNGTTNAVTITKEGAYTGNYYIRTSASGGGWEAYKNTPNNKMEHSDYSKLHSGFDYYHCAYASTGQNVKFTIANDYSSCITDTIDNDTYVTSYGNLPYQANVRFMYDNASNKISRAYLNGSSDGTADYLKIHSNPARTSTTSATKTDRAEIIQSNGTTFTNNSVKFSDLGNWVYQVELKALEGARVKLVSDYRFSSTSHNQYFKGAAGTEGHIWDDENTEEILGGENNEYQPLRIVYDFKTNHLISAWLVTGTDLGDLAINTDVMIIRKNQDDASQITFLDDDYKLTKVDTIYSVMQFTFNHIANKKTTDNTTDSTLTAYEREYYWVSFPYDVKIEDIFGSVGEFNNEWGIMYYDGKERAQSGFWADTKGFWKYFPNKSGTLKAFEGYVIGVDIDMVGQAVENGKWVNSVRDVYLYFPSCRKINAVVQASDTTINIDQTDYLCGIDRRTDKTTPDINKDRTIADSYWHVIGAPSFKNTSHDIGNSYTDDIPSISDWATNDVPFLYEWDKTSNSYTPITTTSYTFKPMYSYMVQYNKNTITWTAVTAPIAPAAIIARNNREKETETEWRLDLMQGNQSVDRTYVRFSNAEAVTAEFEFNYDMTKEFNKNKANIYTFAGYVPTAGNIMPLNSTTTTTVPVGVRIAANGEYTFAMPEGTNGIGVILVDTETNTRTNLGLTDYTVSLSKGTYDGRFVLEISPIQQTPTDIELLNGENGENGARKVMIDGILYIVKDGKVFDATGTKVK